MSEQHHKTVLVDQQFTDFDDLTSAAKFWDLSFRQLDRGVFQGSIFQAKSGDLLIAEARFKRSLHQEGCTPPGMRTFGIPASKELRLNWRRLNVTANDLLIFPKNGELYSISQPDFHIFTVSLPEKLLEEAAENLGVVGLPKLLCHEKVSSPHWVPKLRTKLRHAIDNWSLENGDTDLRNLQSEIALLITQTLSNASSSDQTTRLRLQDRALLKAESLITQFERKPLAVGELCEQVNVSERTLRNAFLAHFGLSPKAYLTARRLNGVRRDLKLAVSTGMNVNEVAAQWGYWHMGQFAADYRKQFGELPSQTLKR